MLWDTKHVAKIEVGDQNHSQELSHIKLHIFHQMILEHFEYWDDIQYKRKIMVFLNEVARQSDNHRWLLDQMIDYKAGMRDIPEVPDWRG